MLRIAMLIILALFFYALAAFTGADASPNQVYDTLDPSVTLLAPTAGEIWYVGQFREITWNASDTNLGADSILIQYSLDDGANYAPLVGPISNTGTYILEIPDLTSDLARIRVIATDAFGNFSQAANPLILAPEPKPLPAQNVSVRITGADAVIEWDPVTHNVHNDPITPDGYLLFHSELASQAPEEYELLAITPGAFYTYVGGAGIHDRRFFYVVAYKGSTGRLAAMLSESGKGIRSKLAMAEVRQYLGSYRARGEQ